MRLKLIKGARKSWRLAVMWFQGAGVAAMGSWFVLTEQQRTELLAMAGVPADKLVATTALILFVFGMFARVVKQDLPEELR